MENQKVVLACDNIEVYKNLHVQFKEALERSNALWYGTIRLIITLSASILFASVSFADKLFPLSDASSLAKIALFSSWALFFVSVVFCILTELMGADSHNKRAIKISTEMKQASQAIASGEKMKNYEIKEDTSFIEYPSLLCAFIGIISFILAILNTVLYLVVQFFEFGGIVIVASNVLVIVFLGILIHNHYKNR